MKGEISYMKSFCLKTNNDKILDYLLVRIEEIDFQDLVYSKRTFKNYNNVIIHYLGNNENEYINFISELILEIILNFYEDKIIKKMIGFNYFYFEEFEKAKILDNCFEIMQEEDYKQNEEKEDIIKKQIIKYLRENNRMLLDGFICFRLKDYFSYLDNVIDISVNKYIVEKEYKEFIDLLKAYVENNTSQYELVHLIYTENEGMLLDCDKNLINISDSLLKNNYLSDISFSNIFSYSVACLFISYTNMFKLLQSLSYSHNFYTFLNSCYYLIKTIPTRELECRPRVRKIRMEVE